MVDSTDTDAPLANACSEGGGIRWDIKPRRTATPPSTTARNCRDPDFIMRISCATILRSREEMQGDGRFTLPCSASVELQNRLWARELLRSPMKNENPRCARCPSVFVRRSRPHFGLSPPPPPSVTGLVSKVDTVKVNPWSHSNGSNG